MSERIKEEDEHFCLTALFDRRIAVANVILSLLICVKSLINEACAEELSDAPASVDLIEQNVRKFKTAVLEDMNKFVSDGAMRAKIHEAFDVFESNASNSSHASCNTTEIPAGGQQGFGYEIVPLDVYARFNGKFRCLKLDREFNPRDPAHFTLLLHEGRHVVQDDGYRQHIPWAQYEIFYSSGPVIVPEDEADAWAVQCEVMNVIMKGSLKKNILKKREVNIPTSNKVAAKLLLQVAKAYYRLGRQDFVKFIQEFYKNEIPDIKVCSGDLRCEF
ncbi:hypothetical protein HZC21_02130 [Candidatus Peregrinibacteria bacterium]|nr:hypothetical protein [Candidatus Peregrinibacteria bacterium]